MRTWSRYVLLSFVSNGLWVEEKNFEIDFDFRIQNDLSIFDPQVTLMLPAKFPVNKSFGSGEKIQNRFIFNMEAMVTILDFRSERF